MQTDGEWRSRVRSFRIPRLVLLDEPTAGMNASETDELGEDIRKVARQRNERPRETLQFETPAERFNACVASTG
jgi:hypothetical protein